MIQQAVQFIRRRIPLPEGAIIKLLKEELPVHLKGWTLFLGGTPALLFGVLVVTGLLLMCHYVPSPDHAYQSVVNITNHVRFGWLVRGIHHAAAHLMVIAILLHMYRVFGTRAYREPRELNWMVGVMMMMTVFGFAFTGYSLVYDQLSYWATTVGTNMMGTAPVVGEPMLYLIRGGPDVNPNTLTRFFLLHVCVLPAVFMLLISCHVFLIRLHGVAPLEGDTRTGKYPFFPDHVLKETIVGLLILIGLVNYVMFFPPGIGLPADPVNTPGEIRPEWYFYPPFQWLKMVPIQVGLWSTLSFLGAMFFWPFIDGIIEKVIPGRNVGRVIGTVALLFLLVLLLMEAVSH